MIAGSGLLFAAIEIFNLVQHDLFADARSAWIGRFVVPGGLAAMFFLALRLKLAWRVAAANALLAVSLSAYAGETYLSWRQNHPTAAGNFDTRDKLTVIQDLRQKGIDAYPVMRAENLLEPDREGALRSILSSGGTSLLPLASVPHATVVSCNESGEWQIYRADRHGFNNPDAAWARPRPAIALVGDSFAHGSCVPQGQDIAGVLRGKVDGVVNLGVGGFGPLLELAALQEYAQPLRPRTVLWLFFEGNDLTEDLPTERHAPILSAYLHNPEYTQDLIDRSGEIEAALRTEIDRKLSEAMERVDGPFEDLVKFVSLDHVREAIGLGPVQIGYATAPLNDQLEKFRDVLQTARERTRQWGGDFRVVYIPESERYFSIFGASAVRSKIHEGVRNIARGAQISLIDLTETFAAAPDPRTLYVYPGSHLNARGYRIAAEAIAAALN